MSKEVKFTDSQASAVITKDKTLLVSAGAGSGKTTVLTQRILERVKSGTDINSILVVTFTKAAAATLKDKLYTALLDASSNNPENTRLAKTVYKIPSAQISTIHSFCLELIKNNFSSISLPPSIRVADDAESVILLGECLENLIDDKFEDENADFLTLCDAFTGEKSLNKFKETVEKVYEKYRAFPFWQHYVISSAKDMEKDLLISQNDGFASSYAGKQLKKMLLERFSYCRTLSNRLYESITLSEYTSKNLAAVEYISDWICGFCACLNNDNSDYDLIKATLDAYDPPNAYTKGLDLDLSEKYKSVKKAIGDTVKKYLLLLSADEERVCDDYSASVKLDILMNNFIMELDKRYTQEKLSRGILDYSDLEQYTLRLLGEDTPNGVVRTALCKEKRDNYEEIYIDEYQDVNPLQDMIFSLLSKSNNRFMVGDIKQSIYRFRNAKADIFLGYLSSYGELGSELKQNKIFLRENFRSKKPILDFVNLLFDRLYTTETVGADYSAERLIYPETKKENALPVTVCTFGEGEEPNEDEAAFVANTIYKLTHEPNENGKTYLYSDIAILLRSPSGTSITYERCLSALGIPYQSEKGGDFLLEPEVLLALSILRVIDNPLNETALASSLRSPVFCFDADMLYSLKRYFGYDSLYDCVKAAASWHKRHISKNKKFKGNVDYRLVARVKHCFLPHSKRQGNRVSQECLKKSFDFIKLLFELQSPSRESTGSRLIWNMYIKTGLISLLSSEDNGKKRVQNLYELYAFAIDFEKTSFKGLSNFLHYISDIADSKAKGLETREEGGNRVRIMSVHKSKGMEFPVCFVSSLGKHFNMSDTSANYIVSDSGFSYCNLRTSDGLTEYTPLVKHTASYNEKKAIMCEELRCLYVALTRPMERLFLTGVKSKGECDFFEASGFMDWIYPIASATESNCFELFEEPRLASFAAEKQEEKHIDYIPKSIFDKAVAFEYSNIASCKIPAKAAVSELRTGLPEDDEYIRTVSKSEATKKPCFVSGDDFASVGTSTHLFMQFADFENTVSNGVVCEIKRLCDTKMILPEDAKKIDVKALELFFKSLLCKDMMASRQLFREKRFNLIERSSLVSENDSENVMIQGVIDCFFENSDGTFTVVDYKTDRVRQSDGRQVLAERHKLQLNYYRRAVERITGRNVSRAIIYSFALGEEIEVHNE